MVNDWDELRRLLARRETGAGELLAAKLHGKAVYDHAAGKWYLWHAQYWKLDPTRQIENFVPREVSSAFLKLAGEDQRAGNGDAAKLAARWAMELCNQSVIKNVLARASADTRLARTGEEWDADTWLLGTPTGCVDLRTGRTVSPDIAKAAHVRNVTAENWQGLDAAAPQFERFVSEIMGDDAELVNFLQRLLGYGLSGSPTERVFPIFYGAGANGKTTLLEIVKAVLGAALTQTITAKALMVNPHTDGERAQPFIRRLRGKRLVWASESEEDAKLNAALVKQVTGNDTITARDLFESPVSFRPTHLLVLTTNEKPDVSAVDQAVWDRLILLPFLQRFTADPQPGSGERQKDPSLLTRLPSEEGPGILAWLVRGCLAWQRYGLCVPDSVRDATQDYRSQAAANDPLTQWLNEACEFGPNYVSQASTDLFDDWRAWAVMQGHDPRTMTWFGRKLGAKYQRDLTTGVVRYKGLQLKQANP